MKTYHMVDRHNPNKAHHIKFDGHGKVFYNQSLKNKEDEWYDLYQDEEVTGNNIHGYSEYIAKAWAIYANRLAVDDSFTIEVNQGEREAVVVAVDGERALAVYKMPAGREFFTVVDRSSRLPVGNVSPNKLPKKWIKACEADDRMPLVEVARMVVAGMYL